MSSGCKPRQQSRVSLRLGMRLMERSCQKRSMIHDPCACFRYGEASFTCNPSVVWFRLLQPHASELKDQQQAACLCRRKTLPTLTTLGSVGFTAEQCLLRATRAALNSSGASSAGETHNEYCTEKNPPACQLVLWMFLV